MSNPRPPNALNPGQEITIAVFTVIGGTLSLLGSSLIVQNIVRKKKYKKDTYHRLLLGCSLCDIVTSVGWIMAPFAAPKASSYRVLSIGNTASCSATGFLIQFGMCFTIYNACLSIYYLLTIRYSVTRDAMKRKERIMHGVCVSWALFCAILPLPLQLYNESQVQSACWLGSFPAGCEASPDVECTRGNIVSPSLIGYIIAAPAAIGSLLIVAICNTLVYRAVRQKELRSRQFAHSVNRRQAKRSRATATQAKWYVVVFVNSILWQLILRLLDASEVISAQNESQWTPFILMSQIFSSSAGFGFLLVYIRPRYLRYRQQDDMSRVKCLLTSLSFRSPPPGRRASSTNAVAPDADGDPSRSRSCESQPTSGGEEKGALE